MIRLIEKLEKSKAFWSLLWISIGFFLLRLPSLIEPNWYGDEGIYQIMGMAINNGTPLYSGIWDNKPPLLYLTYALFNGDQFSTRFASLFVGLFATWVFFFLSQRLFEKIRTSIITTIIFAVLFGIPYLEGNIANAENFMLLPILLAGLLIYKTIETKPDHKSLKITNKLLISGFLLGVAFLFKIVAIFDLGAFLCFLIVIHFPIHSLKRLKWETEKLKTLLIESGLLILGFVIPLVLTVIYFALNNGLSPFLQATFFGMFGYVDYGNKFIIPQGFLLLKLFILTTFVLLLIIKRDKLSHAALFILIWCGFALFNALFAQRAYTHYLLVALPSICLLIGLIINESRKRYKQIFILCLIIALALLHATFKFGGITKTLRYYGNAFTFVIGKKDVSSYQAFFDRKTPRDYELASYIKMHLDPGDPLFVWGDNAQIYALSQTRPINKYTVAYHIVQSKKGLEETQAAINEVRPKYVIILPESRTFPFKLEGYITKFSISDAVIYERAL